MRVCVHACVAAHMCLSLSECEFLCLYSFVQQFATVRVDWVRSFPRDFQNANNGFLLWTPILGALPCVGPMFHVGIVSVSR